MSQGATPSPTAVRSLDAGVPFRHHALMAGVQMRRGLLAVLVGVPFVFAAQPSPVSAGCAAGALRSATVSGIVVATSIDPSVGVIVDVKRGDGSTQQVAFWGRSPTKSSGAVENTVEDAWAGSLPVVGGRYSITGDFGGQGKPIMVSKCAQSPSVKVFGDPPISTAPGSAVGGSDDGGMSTFAMVGLGIGALAVLGALGFWWRRRTLPAERPSADRALDSDRQ